MCRLARWICATYVPSGASSPVSVRPSQRKTVRPRFTGSSETRVRTRRWPLVRIVTVTVSGRRILTLISARFVVQRQVGPNRGVTSVP